MQGTVDYKGIVQCRLLADIGINVCRQIESKIQPPFFGHQTGGTTAAELHIICSPACQSSGKGVKAISTEYKLSKRARAEDPQATRVFALVNNIPDSLTLPLQPRAGLMYNLD